MRRLVADSSIYIDWINAGRHEQMLFGGNVVKYLSAVVLMELWAGAHRVKDRGLLRRLESSFERADRILVPARAVFRDAGEVLRRLQIERGYNLKQGSIVNDVLIALSARSIGAAVATDNVADFRAIQAIRPFELRSSLRASHP
jgi:predicted nucleic acid-binding protein